MPLKTVPYNFLRLSAKLVSILIFCTFIIFPNYLEALQHLGENYPSRKIDKIEIAEERILKKYAKFDSIEILIFLEGIPEKTCVEPAYSSSMNITNSKIECENRGWLFVVDFYPGAHFAHRIDIGILDAVSEKFKIIKSAEWWPLINGKSIFFDSTRWKTIQVGEKTRFFKKWSIKSRPQCSCNFKHIELPPLSVTQDNIVFKDTRCFNNNIWAIIVCGHYESHDKASLSHDTDDMYSLLKAYQVLSERIIYITPNSSEHTGIFPTDVSYRTIQNAFDKVYKNCCENDRFLFFISTHGDIDKLALSNDGKTDELISASNINEWLNPIKSKIIFVFINSCYSGSFVGVNYDKKKKCHKYYQRNDNLIFNNRQKRIVIATASENEYAYGDKDNNCDENYYDRGSEFVSGFVEAFTDIKTDEIKKKDEKISFSEAFTFAEKKCLICGTKCFAMCQYENLIPCMNPVLIPNDLADSESLFWDNDADCPKEENK